MTNRWRTYQQEKFPLLQNVPAIALLSLSSACHAVLLRHQLVERLRPNELPTVNVLHGIGAAVIALMVVALCFVQCHVADAFRTAPEALRSRLDLPAPEGVVTLRELGIISLAIAILQLGLTIAVGWQLIGLLLVVWGYLYLRSHNFWNPNWLKQHPLAEAVILAWFFPLMSAYAMTCEWTALNVPWSKGMLWLPLMLWFNGVAIAIGSNIRAPKDEARGSQNTYSARWGRQKAVMVWLGATWLATLAGLLAAMYIRFTVPGALLLLLLLTSALVVSWRFLARPVTLWATGFGLVSRLWQWLMYLSLGIVPLLLRVL